MVVLGHLGFRRVGIYRFDRAGLMKQFGDASLLQGGELEPVRAGSCGGNGRDTRIVVRGRWN